MLDSGSTMEIVQLIIGIILLAAVNFLFFKFFYNRFRTLNLTREALKFDTIRPIYNALKKEKTPEMKLINRNANQLATRILVYEVLKKYGKTELFPNEFLSREKASESYLANWLDANEDYDSLPDEISHFETKELDSNTTVVIFKFNTFRPHVLSDKGWLFGYVGYDSSNTGFYAEPKFIISVFSDSQLNDTDIKALHSS